MRLNFSLNIHKTHDDAIAVVTDVVVVVVVIVDAVGYVVNETNEKENERYRKKKNWAFEQHKNNFLISYDLIFG